MLSLSNNLSTALNKHSTSSYWYVKLYYGDETNFIGLSDKDRTIGSDVYYGLIASWSNLTYSANLFAFEVKFSDMNLKIINTNRAIDGERFSDLYSSKEFTNRKWELYAADENVSSASDHQILATGIIGMKTSYNETDFSISLNNILNKYNINIPTTLLGSDEEVPEENRGNPIPFVYGDFDRNLSLPSSDFDRHTGEHAPMIITNKWDATNGMIAQADTESLHTLRDKNVEMYVGNAYLSFDDNLVAISSTKFAYITGNLLESGVFVTGVTEVQNFSNTTSKTLSVTGNTDDFSFGIPNLPKGVDRTGLKMLVYYTSDMPVPDAAAPNDFFKFTNTANSPISDNLPQGTNTVQTISLGSTDTGRTIKLRMDASDSGNTYSASIHTIMIVGDYLIEDSVVQETVRHVYNDNIAMSERGYVLGTEKSGRTVEIKSSYNIPKNVRMMYGALKGRKYSSDLTTSRSNNYTTSDFIENPVYIIEDIGRKLLGASIDTTTFDDYGKKDTGKLRDIFNLSEAKDVRMRMSQYASEDADSVLRRICRQAGLFYHFNESGEMRIFGRKRAGDYASGDVTQDIDFDDCNLENISLTEANQLRNTITLKYDLDYATENTEKITSSSTDSTSETDYNIENTLIVEAPFLFTSTVADAYEDTLLDYFKDRKPVIKLVTGQMKYINIEIGDIVTVSNFPSDIKIFGTALTSSDYFMVTNITKAPNMIKLTLTEVS